MTSNNGLKIRTLHRRLGLVMLLPLLGWAATGLIFFLKPGYDGAYEMLPIKTYPLTEQFAFTPDASWLEVRCLKTVLGNHLLVRTTRGWQHLDAATLKPREKPSAEDIRQLLHDAFTQNPARYGQVSSLTELSALTSTNIQVSLDWQRLSLQQKGPDTERIDRLYKIHYLQWTGVKWLDRVLGMTGLVLVTALSLLGIWLRYRSAK